MNNRDMRLKKWKKVMLCLTLALSMMRVACKSKEQQPFKNSGTSDADVTTEPAEPADTEANENKLSLSDIEKLAKENVYHVHWYTSTEGDFPAGTSFIMDSDKFGGKILVTAFHYLIQDPRLHPRWLFRYQHLHYIHRKQAPVFRHLCIYMLPFQPLAL